MGQHGEPEAISAMPAETGLAGAENWVFSDGFVERLRYQVDPKWQGEVPMTALIATDLPRHALLRWKQQSRSGQLRPAMLLPDALTGLAGSCFEKLMGVSL
jgi:hypothetical protein